MSERRVQTQNFKVVLLGEGCVGKTSLVLRYVDNKFQEKHQTTLQASFVNKTLTVCGERVKLSIWDTAGQEKFHALGPIYYRDSNGAVLVYDVTDPDSLSKVKKWVKELRSILGNSVCLAVVGNKIDLLPSDKSLSSNSLISEAQTYSLSIENAVHYCTSAKFDKGIHEMFLDLTKRMLEHCQKQQQQQTNRSYQNAGTSNRTLRIADDNENIDLSSDSNKCNC
ncbi:ras-related protein Rab-21-like protein [Dinothrombium tinctorium]|uniref:Ras-related protein Rab-21 n=1 Tax=Dinothrombium tinctorium TaxID=1965070 RepID=A0A3S4RGQ9_9ACAR|nr:ras-related protein Rab-21-like protein [Dinothrombium tinctorium]RWS15978.1 ras-related protein Rab-21-like protein [Dinothrombium tinctorium]RWS15984.1 ras-related protein Rab-21-like protein [Dinothrombium tinctorium]RWS15987.1 ras-related protein Rab-21-like protein [Dinothrombium tinctorium]